MKHEVWPHEHFGHSWPYDHAYRYVGLLARGFLLVFCSSNHNSKTYLFQPEIWTDRRQIPASLNARPSLVAGAQVLSSSWHGQPFGHNRHGLKIEGCAPLGRGAGSPSNTMWPAGSRSSPRQVSSWSIQPFGQNTPTLQTDRTGQRSDSIGRTVLQKVEANEALANWGHLHLCCMLHICTCSKPTVVRCVIHARRMHGFSC